MENRKSRSNPYQALIEAYEQELLTIDPATCPNVHSQIRMEIRKLRDGVIDTIDLLSNKKVKLRVKIDFPVEQYPNVNFPGKIIGPGGKTLKDLQELTETRMSVLGAGSMRDQSKEIELVQSGESRFQHLNERLHLQVDCLCVPFEAYEKMSKALVEIKKKLTPDPEEMQSLSAPSTWSEISFQQQSMGRGRDMMSFMQDFSSNNFEMRRGGRGGRAFTRGGRGGRGGFNDQDNHSGAPFNGNSTFGSVYGQSNVTSKMHTFPRFGKSEPYPMGSNYNEF